MIRPHVHSALILITNRCNLTCKHCYVSSHPHGSFGIERSRAVELMRELHEELGSLTVNISGGEPLSRASDALAIVEAATHFHKVKLLTNATLITPAIAAHLKRLGVVVRISLDGGTAEPHDFLRGPGAFSRMAAGLENLRSAGYPRGRIEAYATIPPGGLGAIGPILDFAAHHEIRLIKFESLAKGGRAAEYWPRFNHEATDPDIHAYEDFFEHEFSARYGNSWKIVDLTTGDMDFGTLTIYDNGDVLPYTYQGGVDYKLGLLGNVNRSSLSEILAPPRIEEAVMSKFLLVARGPKRSLHAYGVFRSN